MLQGYEAHVPRERPRSAAPLPSTAAPLHDWRYDVTTASWAPWDVPHASILPHTPHCDVFVPTVESVRTAALLDICVCAGHPVLLVGPTGAGKTLVATRHLETMPDEAWAPPALLTLTANANAAEVAEQLEGQLGKLRRGVCGPPAGKRAVVFVDDLHAPKAEECGAQPAIELLRQVFASTC